MCHHAFIQNFFFFPQMLVCFSQYFTALPKPLLDTYTLLRYVFS